MTTRSTTPVPDPPPLNRANAALHRPPHRRRQTAFFPQCPHPRPHEPHPRPRLRGPRRLPTPLPPVLRRIPTRHPHRNPAHPGTRRHRLAPQSHPLLEAALLDRAANPPPIKPPSASTSSTPTAPSPPSACTASDSPASSKKPVDKLREIQAERRLQQERDLKRAAALVELHKHKGLPTIQSEMGSFFQKTKSKPTPSD